MKKVLWVILFVLFGMGPVKAQLGAPTTHVKDTFFIEACVYNGEELSPADYPATYIVEDALNIYIAGFKYVKGRLVRSRVHDYESSWGGYITYYQYNALCNGKREDILKVIAHEDCKTDYDRKYSIGDYEFFVTYKSHSGNQ